MIHHYIALLLGAHFGPYIEHILSSSLPPIRPLPRTTHDIHGLSPIPPSAMASQPEEESPLIAALPPKTDYITYLTLLEYQLTPSNLPILTSLLTNDDGTLAQEIGWDLLKLVLILSEQSPEEAGRCLEVVARRGNPREVVIVIPEELRKLDLASTDDASTSDQEFQDSEDDDGLPTFEGEAPRVHLGTMTLDGMPPSGKMPNHETVDPNGDEHSQYPEINDPTQTKFKIILSILGILHPRIQTKRPSRLLATSLPAAIDAYRRLAINVTTTTAFVSLLEKLSGKQRPALPPRASAVDSAEIHLNVATSLERKPAPLPDPEAENGTASPTAVSADEAAIVKRLLQAVLLEVFEEYIVSLGTQEPTSMSWTARLREDREPKRIIPNRQTETDKWKTDPALQERDTLIARFVQLSKDLGIDKKTVYQQKLTAGTVVEAAEGAESPPEYPTSPEQIPFPKTGTFLIFIADYFVPALADPEGHVDGSAAHQQFVHLTFLLTGIEDSANHPALWSLSTAVIDFLLATLYTAARARLITGSLDMLSFLAHLCSEDPSQYIRDMAHTVATVIFHQSPSAVKLELVRQLVMNSRNQYMRAVAVNWLKDSIARQGPSDPHPDTFVNEGIGDALCVLPRIGQLQIQLPFYVAVLNLLTIAPTEQGRWLIDSLMRLRQQTSEDEVNGIPAIDLWSYDDALKRAKEACEKQDPATRPQWTRRTEWVKECEERAKSHGNSS